MKPITKEELQMLELAMTEYQWNAACDSVKKARDGQYPSDWWDKVKLSGLLGRKQALFAGGAPRA